VCSSDLAILPSDLDALSERQFEQIGELVRSLCGINLHQGKKELVTARLGKRLRQLGITDFSAYLDYLRNDVTGGELALMLDAISTNLTSFFRESDHFDFLAEKLVPRWKARANHRLRIWSAGCSSGEEPYTIAMTLAESIHDLARWDVGILATDLSTRVLAVAQRGVYSAARVDTVPPALRNKYFMLTQSRPDKLFEISPSLRKWVSVARLNLMEGWPMHGPFDAIFCRNVMIYFDKPTQSQLIRRFHDLLAPGGALFIGHSESLAGVQHSFQYMQPTVYEKPQ
jgi:chemotaxis protein methyltransferase CheR